MTVGMDCYPETASVSVRELDNAEPGVEEGTIINLSPEFPIPPEDLQQDLVFPSFNFTREIARVQTSLGVKQMSFGSHEEAIEFRSKNLTPLENWQQIKKGWSLINRGKLDLAKQFLEAYKSHRFDGPCELNYILFDFFSKLLMPGRYALFNDAAEFASDAAKNNAANYKDFRKYYVENLHQENMSRYLEVFGEYFKYFDEFSQTLTLLQHNTDLPNDFYTSSSSFSKTKLFYGNAFEALTSNITVLACIFNISEGRKYNEFKSMTLAKYLTINKAHRAAPFENELALYNIALCLDSSLRNASHHGAMKLTNNGRTIQYRSGATGALKSISHREYVNKCNAIMLSMCALILLELAIAF